MDQYNTIQMYHTSSIHSNPISYLWYGYIDIYGRIHDYTTRDNNQQSIVESHRYSFGYCHDRGKPPLQHKFGSTIFLRTDLFHETNKMNETIFFKYETKQKRRVSTSRSFDLKHAHHNRYAI